MQLLPVVCQYTIYEVVVLLSRYDDELNVEKSPALGDYLPGCWKKLLAVAPEDDHHDAIMKVAIKFTKRRDEEFSEVDSLISIYIYF